MLKKVLKILVLCMILAVVGGCLAFLFNNNVHQALVFLCESMVDNLVFCVFFLAVLWGTGISC